MSLCAKIPPAFQNLWISSICCPDAMHKQLKDSWQTTEEYWHSWPCLKVHCPSWQTKCIQSACLEVWVQVKFDGQCTERGHYKTSFELFCNWHSLPWKERIMWTKSHYAAVRILDWVHKRLPPPPFRLLPSLFTHIISWVRRRNSMLSLC